MRKQNHLIFPSLKIMNICDQCLELKIVEVLNTKYTTRSDCFFAILKNYIQHSDKSMKKIGLEKYCAWRLKWCVFASASGSYQVCVCSIHQYAVYDSSLWSRLQRHDGDCCFCQIKVAWCNAA